MTLRRSFLAITCIGTLVSSAGAESSDPNPADDWSPAQEAEPAASSEMAECVPACRAGFTCHQGRCISACNPPCQGAEVCTVERQCVLPAQAAPPPAHSIATEAQSAAPQVEVPPTEDSDAKAWRREGWAFVPHVGFRVVGGGTSSCERSGLAPCDSDEDYDDASPMLLGMDALRHVSRGVRLGLGLWSVPKSAIKSGNEEFSYGWDTSFLGIFEGVIPVSPSAAITLRFQMGLLLLVAGGELKDEINDIRRACQDLEGLSCRTAGGPFPGFTYGGGIGFVAGNEELRWRIDIASQIYSVDYLNASFSADGAEGEFTYNASGTRGWLLGGVEF